MSRAGALHTWRNDRWVKPFFRQYRTVLACALVLGLAAFLFAGALMFTSGYLISGAASIPETILVLNIPLILVRIFGFGKPILHYLERLQSHDWVLRMTSGLRAALYRSLEKDALFFRATHRTGDILGLLAEDIGHIQNLYLRTVFPTAIAWLLYVVLVAAAGFFSAFLALALVLGLGVVVFVVPLVSVLVNGARRLRYKQLRAELYAELTDNVLGVSDWVFAQRGDEYLQRYRDSERAMKRIALAQDRFDRRRDVVVQAVFALVAVLLLVWAGATFGGGDTGAANWIAAVVLGFFPLIEAFSPLSSAAVDAFAYTDSVARLNALPYLAEDEPAAEPCVPKDPLVLCVDRVHYRYPGTDREVLEGLSLKVAPGEKVAILGRSGAGKSTLATLLRGDIEPNRGSVTLGGAPTCQLHDGAPRYFGVIQQRTYLFNMTLLENLRLAREQASEEQVWEVLEKVGLREMARRLPAGLHTMVDEAGMRFSGGERHRIALARVLLQEVPVVILDEPTVGLDPLTERALLETVFEALEGKTVIMITHHLAGVSLMDRVVFVEDGRVEMDGSPAELARTSERYRSLMAFDRGIELEG
ncbi:MAG: thiol reductant ABC exporter subunit CydC [Gordonibacter sp.]|uniref:thiol reductant ABC exporter subunit CydC n=1 Tax=Gordonibacter sp. TaxID=1968902 RepID=UPI0032208EB7